MADFDLIVRGGSLHDGNGSEPRTADVAVRDGLIVEVGRVDGSAAREIDADGALVIPGIVDIHAHYDGQATWDNRLQPSSWHGVTTVVMSNCGVGFAPVHDRDHGKLIELMEGVEDIPGAALHEGLKWNWNSFGEFLDAAVAHHHGGHAVPGRGGEAAVPHRLAVVVGVDVYIARRHQRTVGVDLATASTVDLADRGDHPVVDDHIGRPRGCS